MANRAAFELLCDSMIMEIVEMRIAIENIKSVKEIKVENEIIKKKTIIPFYKKKIKNKIIKITIEESTAVMESLLDNIDFQDVFSDLGFKSFNGFNYRHEIEYI